MYLLSSIIDGEKRYLRYGLNGAGQPSYCVYRGKIVCFVVEDEALKVRASFDDPESWKIEPFVS